MPTHIRLPDERAEQLRLIARAKNQTIPEVIADFVRAEIEKGTIPDAIPGIDVTKSGPEIVVKARDGFEVSIPLGEGPTVADLLRESGELTPSDPERKARWLQGVSVLAGVELKRAGNGLKIVSPTTKREFPLNLDVAVDLAHQIDKTAE